MNSKHGALTLGQLIQWDMIVDPHRAGPTGESQLTYSNIRVYRVNHVCTLLIRRRAGQLAIRRSEIGDHQIVTVNDLGVGAVAKACGDLIAPQARDFPQFPGRVVGQAAGPFATGPATERDDVAFVKSPSTATMPMASRLRPWRVTAWQAPSSMSASRGAGRRSRSSVSRG